MERLREEHGNDQRRTSLYFSLLADWTVHMLGLLPSYWEQWFPVVLVCWPGGFCLCHPGARPNCSLQYNMIYFEETPGSHIKPKAVSSAPHPQSSVRAQSGDDVIRFHCDHLALTSLLPDESELMSPPLPPVRAINHPPLSPQGLCVVL